MKHTLAAIIFAMPAMWLSTGAMSAAGVVEAQPFTPGQTSSGGQPGAASSNDALVMLLDQFREMRSELETLRGLVEEQAYDLRNLQRESLDRYTDLDSRLSALSSATPPTSAVPMSTAPLAQSASPAAIGGAATNSPTPTTSFQSTPPATASSSTPLQASGTTLQAPASTPMSMPTEPTVSPSVASNTLNTQSTLQPTVLSEQQQYQMALDSLLQEEQYQRAVNEFDQYLRLYPNGRFVTNAYYWKGQAYVNLSMLNEARQAFETIVTQYPDGRKVDDAMYSLGTVYDKLGDTARAQQLLRQVQSRYPNTSAANLADIYLRAMN